jgi:hypothetical protein
MALCFPFHSTTNKNIIVLLNSKHHNTTNKIIVGILYPKPLHHLSAHIFHICSDGVDLIVDGEIFVA